VVVLVVFSGAAIVEEWNSLAEAFSQVGVSVVIFNVVAPLLGFHISRAMQLYHPSAVATPSSSGFAVPYCPAM